MATLDLIAQRTSALPETMQRDVLAFIDSLFAKNDNEASPIKSNERTAGLHTGNLVISDDFNEPLPDSFWLGQV
jgi:hypothetical protein